MSAERHSRRIGIVLAAGRGGRMGGKKQLIPWSTMTGSVPLVAAAYDAIGSICNEMIVVVGHDADAVAAALAKRTFHRVESNPSTPMFESIRAGLRAAQRLNSSASIVLQPGDHPEVSQPTLESIVDWSTRRPTQAIIPQYGGRGGHPVLIPARLCARLIEAECPGGLGQYWLDHPELCHRVPVEDPTVVRDIDAPSDLHRLD